MKSLFTFIIAAFIVISYSGAYCLASSTTVKKSKVALTPTLAVASTTATNPGIHSVLAESKFYAGDSYVLSRSDISHSNIYVAAGDINLDTKVSGDANLVGGNITVVSDIGEDMTVVGANVNVSSNVSGDLKIIGGKVYVNGNVGGDLVVIGGDVFVSDNVKVGGVKKIYNKSEMSSSQNGASSAPALSGMVDSAAIMAQVLIAFGAILFTAVIYFSFRGAVTYVAMQASDRTSRHIVFGLIFFLLAPIAIVLISLTGIGVYLSAAMGIMYILLILVANGIVAITIGAGISRYIVKRNPSVDWSSVLVGSLTTILLSLIPYLGFAIKSTVFLATFGVLVKYIYIKARE